MPEEPATPVQTFTIPDPSFGDPCPLVPEGATEWERQEIDRAWRDVLRYAAEACRRIEGAASDPAHPNRAGNEVANVGQMLMAQTSLHARIEGVEHRLRFLARTARA